MIDFHELKIWQRSVALAVDVSIAVKGRGRRGPRGLVAQLQRSCGSIHANIAEGAGSDSPAQFARFLDIAIGSLNESESHLREAAASSVLSAQRATQLTSEIQQLRRMTLAFKRWVLRNEQ